MFLVNPLACSWKDFSDTPAFDPFVQIWKVKVPSKVNILAWAVAHGKLNTCDKVQRRRPGSCPSPYWCIMCRKGEESVDRVFLQCPSALSLLTI